MNACAVFFYCVVHACVPCLYFLSPFLFSLKLLCATKNRWTTLLPARPAMTRSAVAAGAVAADAVAAGAEAADSAVVGAEVAGEAAGVVAAAAAAVVAGSARGRSKESSHSRAPRSRSTNFTREKDLL